MHARVLQPFVGLVAVTVAGLALAACASPAASSAGADGTTIAVTLTEYAIAFSPSTVPAGEVTFDVTNGGTIVHEFVVFRTDLAADALPEASGEDAVDEASTDLESMGEVEDVDEGATKSFTATLDPGSYVAICNVEAHYGEGMRLAFTVD